MPRTQHSVKLSYWLRNTNQEERRGEGKETERRGEERERRPKGEERRGEERRGEERVLAEAQLIQSHWDHFLGNKTPSPFSPAF